mmetsp:Transcript_23498/g.76476  ORF Transcript_23498/g.76476 Transcript_23498/m.76476 type:complete len:468 (-) Transcript_23498:14-1417(-)
MKLVLKTVTVFCHEMGDRMQKTTAARSVRGLETTRAAVEGQSAGWGHTDAGAPSESPPTLTHGAGPPRGRTPPATEDRYSATRYEGGGARDSTRLHHLFIPAQPLSAGGRSSCSRELWAVAEVSAAAELAAAAREAHPRRASHRRAAARAERRNHGRQVRHVRKHDVGSAPVLGPLPAHQHPRVPVLVGDVGCADVADDQADLRIGGGADPARRVLHRHAPGRRQTPSSADVRGGSQVHVRRRLEARRVEVRLARVDVCVVGRKVRPEAARVDADWHARLAGGGGDHKGHAGLDQRLECGGRVRRRGGCDREPRVGVGLLLREQGRLRRAGGEDVGERLQPQLCALRVHRRCERRGCERARRQVARPGLLDRQQPAGRCALRVHLFEHELEGLAGILHHKSVPGCVEPRRVRGEPLERRHEGRELPKGDVHRRRLGVAQRAVKVEEDADAQHRRHGFSLGADNLGRA